MRITGEIRTYHANARCVAESVSADNLNEMETLAEGNFVISCIASSRIRSVIASIDDYLTNIAVAEEVCGTSAGLAGSPEHTGKETGGRQE